ncbi:MAG: sigma factor [Verrucomicrobiales bacterium]
MLDEPDKQGGEAGLFPLTAWSRIVAAQGRGDSAREAMEEVCLRYWHPARKFLRSLGCSEHDAEDITQRFFARWARAENFERLDPGLGRLRSYLKQALRREWINDWKRRSSRPQDGGAVSLDDAEMAGPAAAGGEESDAVYDAAWAEAVVAAAMQRLRAEYAARGRAKVLDAILPCIFGTDGLKPYAEAAVSAGMTEPQFKLEVHRLRRRFADRLRDEVAGTLADPADIEDELRYVVKIMARFENAAADVRP